MNNIVSIHEYKERRNKRAKLANDLERYNRWRRGAEDIEQPNPAKLGILIDEVAEELRQ